MKLKGGEKNIMTDIKPISIKTANINAVRYKHNYIEVKKEVLILKDQCKSENIFMKDIITSLYKEFYNTFNVNENYIKFDKLKQKNIEDTIKLNLYYIVLKHFNKIGYINGKLIITPK